MLEIASLALSPVVFFFTLIYWRDHHQREPIHLLVRAFVYGVLLAAPLAALQSVLGVGNIDFRSPWWISSLIYSALVFGISEELGKFLTLRFTMYRRSEFDEPYDGIMYGVAISLGFAAIENFLYITAFGLTVGWLRMFTAIPGHAMFGVVMGYYVGHAKFAADAKERASYLWKGFACATTGHTLYDLFAFASSPLSIPLILIFLGIGWHLAGLAMIEHQQWAAVKAAQNREMERRERA